MPKNDYVPEAHSWVLFTEALPSDRSFCGPCPIVLHGDKHVWVFATYADLDDLPSDVLQVGDSRSNGMSLSGECIVSVPLYYVAHYYTDDEALMIAEAINADQTLLRYAR